MFLNPLPKSQSRIETKLIVVILSLALWFSSNNKVSSLSDSNDTNYIIKNQQGIIVEPVNSTTFKVYHNATLKKWTGQDIKKIKLRVQYQLIANNRGNPHNIILCDDETRLRSLIQLNNIDVELCKGDLHGFGILDWTDKIGRPDYLEHLCEPKHFYLNYSEPHDYKLVTNLLPYQPYQFRYSLEYEPGNNFSVVIQGQTGFENACLPEGPPSHAPQTSSSSFTVHTSPGLEVLKNNSDWLKLSVERRAELEKGNLRRVKLFWRVVPAPFITSNDTRYDVSCWSNTTGANEIYSARVRTSLGHHKILRPLQRDINYKCDIYTVNRLGRYGPSSIIIHEQKNIIEHDKFELYAASAGLKGFLLSWPKMDKLLMRNLAENTTLSGDRKGVYTYYWCLIIDSNFGCSSLEGIGETHETESTIQPHISNYNLRPRQFGISYKFPNSDRSTGIIWADCVANVEIESQSIMNPMLIKGASGVPDNHTSIHVSWIPKGCKSIYAVISKFELTYCKIDSVSPCSFTTHRNRTEEEISNFNFTSLSKDQCRSREINSLEEQATDVTLQDLEPSSEYAIRLRHYVAQEPITWTEPAFAITYPEPETLKDCWSLNIVGLAVLISVLISIGLLSYCALRDARGRYKEFKVRLNEANSEMPQRIQNSYIKDDNISDIGLKFWSNKYTNAIEMGRSASEFSLDYTEQGKKGCTITFQNSPSELASDHVAENICESDQVAASSRADNHQDQTYAQPIYEARDACHFETEAKEEKNDPEEEEGEEEEEEREESETQLFMPSMSGYVPSQHFTRTTEHHPLYCENYVDESPAQNKRDWTPPDDCDQISVASHTSFLKNIFNHPTAQENY